MDVRYHGDKDKLNLPTPTVDKLHQTFPPTMKVKSVYPRGFFLFKIFRGEVRPWKKKKTTQREEVTNTINKDIQAIAEKHNLTNCFFGGTDSTGQLLGFMVGNEITLTDMWITVLNVGRLWQWARDEVRAALNMYDRRPASNKW